MKSFTLLYLAVQGMQYTAALISYIKSKFSMAMFFYNLPTADGEYDRRLSLYIQFHVRVDGPFCCAVINTKRLTCEVVLCLRDPSVALQNIVNGRSGWLVWRYL